MPVTTQTVEAGQQAFNSAPEVRWMGPYRADFFFPAGSLVTSGGNLWVAQALVSNDQPPADPATVSQNWDFLASAAAEAVAVDAADVTFDPDVSGLVSTDVGAALIELKALIDGLA